MKPINHRFMLILPLCLIAATSAVAQIPSPATSQSKFSVVDKLGFMTPELLAQDKRLTAPVQGIYQRIYLAELMEKWSEETGVAFEARDVTGDDSGRYRIFYGIRTPITVGEAMNALRSVMSKQGASWEWQRSGKAPDFKYRLVRPLSIDQINAALKDQVKADYMLQLEEGKKAISSPSDNTPDTTGFGKIARRDDDVRLGLNLFTSALTPQQQAEVLQGKTLTLNVADLGNLGQQFSVKYSSSSNALKKITFETDWTTIAPTPSLMIMSDGGGNAYLGGMPAANRWREKLAKDSLLSTDSATPFTSSLLTEPTLPPASKSAPLETDLIILGQGLHGLEDALSMFVSASAPQINFLTYLPQHRFIEWSMPRIYNRPLGNLLEKGLGEMSLASKWQKDILLLSYTSGFASGDSVADAPPYALYVFLRDHHDTFAKQRRISLVDFATLTKLGSKEQNKTLGEEYPAVFSYLNSPTLALQYDVLTQIAQQPEAEEFESETGMRLTDLRPSLRMLLPIPQGTPRAACVVFRQAEKDGVINASLNLQLPEAGSPLVSLIQFDYPVPQERKAIAKQIKEHPRLPVMQ